MEFQVDCEKLFRCDKLGYSLINSNSKQYIPQNIHYYVDNIIDTIGNYSSNARKLNFVVTSSKNFFTNENEDFIILKIKQKWIIGFIRFGFENIIIRDKNYNNKSFIKRLLTIKDFYVYSTMQKQSHGKEIFDKIIELYNIKPNLMAYHIPNNILFRFLFKNYLIKNPIQEDNDIWVYSDFKPDFQETYNKIDNSKISFNENDKFNNNRGYYYYIDKNIESNKNRKDDKFLYKSNGYNYYY